MKIPEFPSHSSAADDDLLLICPAGTISTKQIKLADLKAYLGTGTAEPPPPVSGDTYTADIVLLLHMEGANNSIVFTDVKGKLVSPSGNVKISTVKSKFGSSSAYFDGAGSYLSIPTSPDFLFGADDFTWECWVRPESLGTSVFMTVLGNAQGSQAGNSGMFLTVSNSKFVFRHWVNGSSNASSLQTIVLNTWYHVAVIKTGTTTKIFVDGVQGVNGSTTLENQDNQFRLGTTLGNAGYATDFQGYIDEVRITKGVARYVADFDPPTAAFS